MRWCKLRPFSGPRPLNLSFPVTMRFVPITCYFDAFPGISGDMTVGVLADAGADQSAIADGYRFARRGGYRGV